MSFSDAQILAAKDAGVVASQGSMAKLNEFCLNVSELGGVPYQSVAVPVFDFEKAGEFSETNNYGSGDEISASGSLVTLNKHYVKGITINDKTQAFTGINWITQSTKALVGACARAFEYDVIRAAESNAVTATANIATWTATSEETIETSLADIYAKAEKNGIAPQDAVLVCSPAMMGALLAYNKYNVTGTDYYITGVIKNIMGFNAAICTNSLATANGLIVQKDAIVMANRYLQPSTPESYPESFSIVDEFGVFGARRYEDLAYGNGKYSIDFLGGYSIALPKKIVTIK